MTFFYLHGMGGSAEDWAQVQKLLPGKAIELPSTAASLPELISLLANTLESRDQVVLCGYSMGGRLALLLASELRSRGRPVAGLAILSAGMGFASESERAERREIDDRWSSLAAYDSKKFWDDWYRQPLFAAFQKLPELVRSRWLEKRKTLDISGLVRQLRFFGASEHQNLLPLLAVEKNAGISVLYLAGELDKKYLTLGQELADMRQVRLGIIPGAGHILPLEAPEQVADHLRTFFSPANRSS